MKTIRVLVWVVLSALAVFAGEPFYFVQLTDTHFGQNDHFERAGKAVRQINALPMEIEFVVLTGDIMNDCITDSNRVEQVFQTLAPLTAPVHFLPGNHDILAANLTETLGAYTHSFGPLIRSVDCHGVRCVFVYTEPLVRGEPVSDYDPLAELEPLLEGRESLVFHHTPAVDNFFGGTMHPGWGRTDSGRRWRELLNRYDVKAVIAGHFHRDELHRLGDVPLFAAPPLSVRFGRQSTFRVYEYRDGTLDFWTVYLD